MESYKRGQIVTVLAPSLFAGRVGRIARRVMGPFGPYYYVVHFTASDGTSVKIQFNPEELRLSTCEEESSRS